MAEFKLYDSSDKYRMRGVRLAKDPRVNDGEYGKQTSLTFVSTSRKEKHKEMWWTANVHDFQADIAAFLLKGDVLHEIEGKPVNRPWQDKDGNDRDSFELERAEIVIPAEMFAVLRERGWEPTTPNKKAGAGKAGPAAKKGAVGGKKNPPQGKKKPVVDIDADDAGDEGEE